MTIARVKWIDSLVLVYIKQLDIHLSVEGNYSYTNTPSLKAKTAMGIFIGIEASLNLFVV